MLNKVTVSEWMSKPAITIDSKASVDTAQKLMKENKVRRLLVVNEREQLVGIVTSGDLREARPSDATTLSIWELTYLVSQLTVAKIMRHEMVTISSDSRMVEAAKLMLDHKVSGLPVMNANGDVVGVITESDIFRMVVQNETDAILTS